MNRRGIELAINFIVILILALIVLIAIGLYFSKSSSKFEQSTKPFLDVAASSAIKKSCELACNLEDKQSYCCKELEIDKEKIFCSDKRLELDCSLSCDSVC